MILHLCRERAHGPTSLIPYRHHFILYHAPALKKRGFPHFFPSFCKCSLLHSFFRKIRTFLCAFCRADFPEYTVYFLVMYSGISPHFLSAPSGCKQNQPSKSPQYILLFPANFLANASDADKLYLFQKLLTNPFPCVRILLWMYAQMERDAIIFLCLWTVRF